MFMFDGMELCLWTAATNGPIVHSIDEYGATVEWYWQEK
jgi:hypothetical protein